jgi:hypothetical protein
MKTTLWGLRISRASVATETEPVASHHAWSVRIKPKLPNTANRTTGFSHPFQIPTKAPALRIYRQASQWRPKLSTITLTLAPSHLPLQPASTASKSPAKGSASSASKSPAKVCRSFQYCGVLLNRVFKVGKTQTKRTAKSVAPAADKKKPKKRRKETYNSYIYKGAHLITMDGSLPMAHWSAQTGPP